MSIKSLTALVGTLSLGALATGCATAKPTLAPTEQGSAGAAMNSPSATTTPAAMPAVDGTGTAQPTPEKAAEHACGAGGCGGSGCGGKK